MRPNRFLSLILFVAAACALLRLVALFAAPPPWTIVPVAWMGAIPVQRLLFLLGSAAPLAGALLLLGGGAWLDGRALARLGRRASDESPAILDRASFAALWLFLCFCGPIVAERLFPVAGHLGEHRFLVAVATTLIAVPIHILAVLVLDRPGTEMERSRSFAVLVAGSAVLFVGLLVNRWLLPGFFHPVSLAVTAALLFVGVPVAAMSLGRKREMAGRCLQRVASTRLLSPVWPTLALLVFAGIAVATGLRSGPATGDGGSRPPNIVLITVDTLRMDHLGCYGHPGKISPRLDAFAEEAALFERAVSTAPWTVPSFVSILTGKYVSYHSVGPVNGHRAMSLEEATMPRVLSDRGYRTAAFVSNYLLRRRMNMHGGFDTYDDTYTSEELRRGMPERTADSVNEFVVNWLDSRARREPFFLWVHYQDPHGPYTPPARFREKFPDATRDSDPAKLEVTTNEGRHGIPTYQYLGPDTTIGRYRALYEAEVAFADEKIGELIDHLKELGLWEDALVVFTSDHGEALGEHDYWFCHGHDVTEDQIRVPLIVKLPGPPRPRRIDELVSTVDVAPTCLDVAGAPDGLPANGTSLVGLIEGTTGSLKRQFVFSEDGHGRVSLRTRDRKYILSPKDERLFDLVADPGETESRLGRTSADPLAWRMKVVRYRAEAKPVRGEDLEQSARELERLRSLGYID